MSKLRSKKLKLGAEDEAKERNNSSSSEDTEAASLQDILAQLVTAEIENAEHTVDALGNQDKRDELTQLMQDMSEFRDLAQAAESLRRVLLARPTSVADSDDALLQANPTCVHTGGRVAPQSPDQDALLDGSRTLNAGPLRSSQSDQDITPSFPLDEERDPPPPMGFADAEEAASRGRRLFVALRVNGMLQMTFHEALRACPALARHIGAQEDPMFVEEEFALHWHPDAPAALRLVLEELIAAEEGGIRFAGPQGEEPVAPAVFNVPPEGAVSPQAGLRIIRGLVHVAGMSELRRSKL